MLGIIRLEKRERDIRKWQVNQVLVRVTKIRDMESAENDARLAEMA